jgi:four helix bundle protein
MASDDQPRQYDLEDCRYEFARDVRAFVRQLPHTVANFEDVKQPVRASGSVGANYIEANEALGRKDFVMHFKICQEEAKESRFFLRLVFTDGGSDLEKARTDLVQEATELMSIFGSIVRKSA